MNLRLFARGVLLIGLSSIVVACTDDGGGSPTPGTGGPTGGAGGSTGGAGGGASGGGAGEGGGLSTCKGAAKAPAIVTDVDAVRLRAAGDGQGVLFIDRAAGPPSSGAGSKPARTVERVNVDGAGRATVYAAAEGHQVLDVTVDEGGTYVIEDEGGKTRRLIAVAADGVAKTLVADVGAVERFLPEDDGESGVVWAAGGLGPGKTGLFRIDLAKGAVAQVATTVALSFAGFAGDHVYWQAAPDLMSDIMTYRVPKAGGEVTMVGLPPAPGGLLVGPDALYTVKGLEVGAFRVKRWGLDGSGPTELFAVPFKEQSEGLALGAVTPTAVYAFGEAGVASKTPSPLRRVALDGTGGPIIACLGAVAVAPTEAAYEARVVGEALVAIDVDTDGKRALRRLPR